MIVPTVTRNRSAYSVPGSDTPEHGARMNEKSSSPCASAVGAEEDSPGCSPFVPGALSPESRGCCSGLQGFSFCSLADAGASTLALSPCSCHKFPSTLTHRSALSQDIAIDGVCQCHVG